MFDWINDISKIDSNTYSQFGEDGKLEYIFRQIGTLNKIAVEFGAADGYWLSNIRKFMEQGWKGFQFDIVAKNNVFQEKITAENINEVFSRYMIPREFDLLSIDIDGNDYWVWKALEFKPRVVIIEINVAIPLSESKTIQYDPDFRFVHTDYYGASLSALIKLGKEKGYTFIHQNASLNAFFVDRNIVPELEVDPNFTPKYPFPPSKANKEWVYV